MNQGRFISRNAIYWGDQPAILFKHHTVSYRQLDLRSNRLANALLGMGLQKGDRVAIQAWNRPEIIELECALYKAGLVKVALNARLSSTELAETTGNAGARVLIVDAAHREAAEDACADLDCLAHLVGLASDYGAASDYETLLSAAAPHNPDIDMQADDLAALHFTSGSTGKLKAA